MAEKNPKKMRIPNDQLSDSDSSEEETSQHLCTSPEEILYHTIKGSAQAAQATQVALAHTTAQCNPTVKRGPAKWSKIKKLLKGQASDKLTQRKISLIDTQISFSIPEYISYYFDMCTVRQDECIQLDKSSRPYCTRDPS